MKLLLITGIFPPDIGGPATYVPLLAKEAANRYQQISIVTLGNNSEISRYDNYKVFKVKREIPKPLRVLKTLFFLFREAKNSQAIFCNGLYLETAIVLRLLKLKSVAKIVGDPVWEKARNESRTSLNMEDFQNSKWKVKDKFINLLFCSAWKSFTYLTCPSPALSTLVQKRTRHQNVVYIPNGVDLPKKTNIKKNFSLITVSRLVSWKNIDRVIEAANILGVRLIIIGDGPERSRLEEIARRNRTLVKFAGILSPSEVRKKLEESRYFLQVSDYEGLSFSLLEAMAHGVVPIVSDNEGNKIVIKNNINGIYSEIDSLAIANSIHKIEIQPNFYNQLSKEAIRTVTEGFNGKTNRNIMLDLLETSA